MTGQDVLDAAALEFVATRKEEDSSLYIAVTRKQLEDIKKAGLPAGTAFKSHSLAQKSYFEIEGKNEEAFILMVSAKVIPDGGISIDPAALMDPDADHIGDVKANIWHRWQTSGQSWQDSLAIVQSVVCEVDVPATSLKIFDDYFGEPSHRPLVRKRVKRSNAQSRSSIIRFEMCLPSAGPGAVEAELVATFTVTPGRPSTPLSPAENMSIEIDAISYQDTTKGVVEDADCDAVVDILLEDGKWRSLMIAELEADIAEAAVERDDPFQMIKSPNF
jgi:hypothetical protein